MSTSLTVIAVIAVALVLLGLMLGKRRTERHTITFDAPVRRAEARLRAGALLVVASDGPVCVHRTVRSALTRPATSERVEDGVLRIEATMRPGVLGGDVSYRVEARTNAGRVELSVPDERYAVEAMSSAGSTQVDVASDPAAPRRLVARSNAGTVWVRRA